MEDLLFLLAYLKRLCCLEVVLYGSKEWFEQSKIILSIYANPHFVNFAVAILLKAFIEWYITFIAEGRENKNSHFCSFKTNLNLYAHLSFTFNSKRNCYLSAPNVSAPNYCIAEICGSASKGQHRKANPQQSTLSLTIPSNSKQLFWLVLIRF